MKSYDYENEEGGFSALTMTDEVGGLQLFEFGRPPLARAVPPLIFRGKHYDILFVQYRLDYDSANSSFLRAYLLDHPGGPRADLRMGGDFELAKVVGDFDGDGAVEVLNLEVKQPGAGLRVTAYLGVRSVYRLVLAGPGQNWSPYFVRVKGSRFEKQFVAHAAWLLERKYPELLKVNQLKAAESVIFSWLATIESTENPELIRDALARLDKLPYPDSRRKQEIVEAVRKSGHSLLVVPSGK